MKRRHRSHVFAKREAFTADGYSFRPGPGHVFHVWKSGTYLGAIVEKDTGYDFKHVVFQSELDDALNSFIGHKHRTVYA